MAMYNASYIAEPKMTIHETTVCIGSGCWNGNEARQLHPNLKRNAGLWGARIKGVSNYGRTSTDIINNIAGTTNLTAVFDTTTRFMIFPSAVYDILRTNWGTML
jgi:hypothetical protein